MNAYDLIIIGGGPAGYEAAFMAADLGMHTALIEKAQLGGTCLNRGCIPTKTLLYSTEVYASLREKKIPGVSAKEIRVDRKALLAREEEVTAQLRDGIAGQLAKKKIDGIGGTASVPEPHKVAVRMTAGEVTLTGRYILIAAGSAPVRLPVPGCDLPGVLTSDDLLRLDRTAESLTVIGGGVIGAEMAFLYSELGSRVTILEYADRILPGLDREISQNVKMLLTGRGIEIHTSAQVTEIAQGTEIVQESENGASFRPLICRYTDKAGEHECPGEQVLMAAGRRPVTEGLFPGEIRPEMRKGRIVTDVNGRTSMEGVYAAGDAADGIPMLAHAASASAVNAVCHMAGKSALYDMNLVPSCVYLKPEIACVGITEREAKEKGIAVLSGKYPMTANGKSVLSGAGRGYIRVVAEKESHRILGAALMCERASDIIGEFTLAIKEGLTLEQMRGAIRPHPTFEEAIGKTLEVTLERSAK